MCARRAIVLTFVILAAGRAPAADAPPIADILLRAGAYTQQYEERFALVVSDERYTQDAMSRGYSAPRHRVLTSEMLFLWLADERAWLAVRNVLTVDGRQVGDSDARLDRLLSGTAPIGVGRLRRLRNEGARFNIGSIGRNFNEPMLPLRVLEAAGQRRFAFSADGDETIDGVRARRLAFEETSRPTIVQDNGRDRPSRGVLWIGAGGEVLRTRLELGDRLRGYTASILVTYRRDAKLDMLVPATMHEAYMQITTANTSGPMGAVAERIDCDAAYSNYRRFETAARIVPEP